MSIKNIFKDNYKDYFEKGFCPVPDKQGSKGFLLKGYAIADYEAMSLADISKLTEDPYMEEKGANLAITLGKRSGVVCLDLDTDSPEILEKIEHLLPKSPVEKVGSKGFGRFFKYSGEPSQSVKDQNGNMVLEILSDNSKCTLPPSLHTNGSRYTWSSEKTLLDINIEELPMLPPMLIPVIQQKLTGDMPHSVATYGKISNGRNQLLSSFLGELLAEPHDLQTVIQELIKKDKSEHEQPYFTDPNEHRHTHDITNALSFYASHMESYNAKRFRESKEYVEPALPVGKRTVSARPKKLPTSELQPVQIAKKVYDLYTKGTEKRKSLGLRDNENSK